MKGVIDVPEFGNLMIWDRMRGIDVCLEKFVVIS